MATYLEIFNIVNSDDGSTLRNKVTVAVAVKADEILGEASPAATRLAWAKEALEDPNSKANLALYAVLAANNTATVAQITGATDTQIQTNVHAAIDKLFP